MPFIDLRKNPPDREVVARLGLAAEELARLRRGCPSGGPRAPADRVGVRPDERLADDIRALTGWEGEVIFRATTGWDLRAAVLRAYGAEMTQRAASSLAERAPQDSASRVVTRRQALVLLGAIVLFGAVVGYRPDAGARSGSSRP